MSTVKVMKIVCSAMLQSWRNTRLGNKEYFTELCPTKSGVSGLFACALGYPRGDEKIERLQNSFELYLSVKESGPLLREQGKTVLPFVDTIVDFQTVKAGKMMTAEGRYLSTASVMNKEYIVNHRFVLYVVAPEQVLKQIAQALKNPKWDYFLGSKCCIPAEPVFQGFYDYDSTETEEKFYDYQHIRV